MILELNTPEQTLLLDTLVTHMKTEVGAHSKDPNHWREFFHKLKPLGLTGSKRDTIAFWATSQSRKVKRTSPKIRLVHPMEAEILTPEAYGYLLELCHIGLLHGSDFDLVLEEASGTAQLPVDRDNIKNIVIRILARLFSEYDLSVSH